VNWLDSYLHRAVAEVVLVGALAGIVGVQVVLRRLAFFTMAMTHATFPGVVLAAIIGFNLYLGGAVAGLVVSAAVLATSRRRGQDNSTATGVVLATGFALGVALMSTQPGFTRNLSAFLVGSVLTVDGSDLITATAVMAGVAAVTVVLRKELLYLAFDPGGARAAGYPVAGLDLAVLVTVQAAVVTAVPAVGTILCVALIVAPAAAARLWTDRIAVMHTIAISLAVGSGLAGLALSQRYDVAAGGMISLVAAGAFAVSWLAAPRHGAIRQAIRSTRSHRAGSGRRGGVDRPEVIVGG
jgi:ABC-type Mn2+/Zn2+ transport system permease subunit